MAFEVWLTVSVAVLVEDDHPAMDEQVAASLATGRLNDVLGFMQELGSIDGFEVDHDSMVVE